MNAIKTFLVNLKRLPKAGGLIVLMIFSGFSEGIGISMMLPVLSFVTGQTSLEQLPKPFNLLPVFLQTVHIPISLLSMLGFTAVLILLSFMFTYLQERALFWSRFEFLRRIRLRTEKVLFSSSWAKLSELSSGDIANRLSNESRYAAESLMAMAVLIAQVIQVLIYTAFAMALSIKMSLIVAFSMLLVFFVGRGPIARVRKIGQISTDSNNLYGEQLVDFLRGAKIIKATAAEPRILQRLKHTNNVVCSSLFKICSNQSLLRFQVQTILGVFLLFILYVSLDLLHIHVSVVLVFLLIIMRFTPRISTIQGQYYNYAAYMPALRTVDDLIHQAEQSAEIVSDDLIKFDRIKSGIVVRNLSFTYLGKDEPALRDVSLSFPAKKMIGVVGGSGGGKSTLIDILVGLRKPSDGQVEIDDIPLFEYDLKSWRHKIGYVTQESLLLNATVRDNMALAHDISEAYMWECLDTAQLGDFVRSLPDKLDTELGENGVKMSGGQKQRLALARALAGRPEVLLLDEATSALDNESERLIQKALDEVAGQYTMIIIAHRLSTIRKTDKIYVIEEGRVIEEGTYKDLLAEGGRFSQLHDLQFE